MGLLGRDDSLGQGRYAERGILPSPGRGNPRDARTGYARGMKVTLGVAVVSLALAPAPGVAGDAKRDLGAFFPGFRSALVVRDVAGRDDRAARRRSSGRACVAVLDLQDPELADRPRDGRHPRRVLRPALGRRAPPEGGVEPRPRPALGDQVLGRLVLPGAGAARGPRADAEVGLGPRATATRTSRVGSTASGSAPPCASRPTSRSTSSAASTPARCPSRPGRSRS